MKTSNLILTATTIAILMAGALAQTANATGKGRDWAQNASRAEVVFQCHANNGTAYDVDGGASGYGCVTATGSIHCDGDGNCETDRSEYVVPQKRATFRLPQPRLR